MPDTQYLTDDEEEIEGETPEERALRLAQLQAPVDGEPLDDQNAPVAASPNPAAEQAMDDSGPNLSWVKSVDPANGKTVSTPVPSNYDKANANLRDVVAQAPVKSEPKWWERVAAGAAGGLAGWTNAAGRSRPIDIAKVQDNLLAPGYQSKLESWRSRVAPAQAELELESQRVGAQQSAAENAAKIAQQGAETKMQQQHGAYWQSRSEQERNQWKIDPKTGSLYNTITGAVSAKPPTPKDRYDTAVALGATPEEAKFYSLNGKVPLPEKPPAEKNMNPTDVLMHPQDFDTATVGNAQKIFDREHKAPVVNVNSGGQNGTDASDDSRINSIINGDIPAPTTRSKDYHATMNEVLARDPSYTESRYKVKQNYKTGKDATKIQSITRILGHLDSFDQNSKNLGWSTVGLPGVGNITGDQRALHEDADAITSEFGRLVHGGVLTQSQADRAEQNLISVNPTVRARAVQEVDKLLGSQFKAVFQSYRTAAKQEFPVQDFFDPETQEQIQRRGYFKPGAPNVTIGDRRPGAPTPGGAPSAGPGNVQPHGIPDIGATFNGGKVLKVTRIQ